MANTIGSLIKFYCLVGESQATYDSISGETGALIFATISGATSDDDKRIIRYNGDATHQKEWVIPKMEDINELIGALSALTTDDKTNIVAAINELVSDYDSVTGRVVTLETTVSSLTNDVETLSAETADKVASVTASDTSIVTGGTATNVTLAVQISEATGNVLIRNNDGLFVNQGASPDYTIEKISPASSEWASQYRLLKNNEPVSGSVTIDIPKDQFLDEVVLVTAATQDHPDVPYLKFTWEIEGASGHSETWVSVNDLVDCLVHSVSGETGETALIQATTVDSAVTITSTPTLQHAVASAETAVQSVTISSASTNGEYVVVTDTTASGSKDKSFTIGLNVVESGSTNNNLTTDGYVNTKIDEAIENTVSAVTTSSTETLISVATDENRVVTVSSTDTLQSAVTSARTAVQTINVTTNTEFVSATTVGTTAITIGLSVGLATGTTTQDTGLATDGYVQDAITEALEDFDKYTEGNGIDITESGDSKVISVQTKTGDYVTIGADGVQLDSDKIESSGSTITSATTMDNLVTAGAVYNAFCWNVVTGS